MEAPQPDVVAGIEHPAEGIPAAVDQVFACFLGGCCEHDGPIELLGQQGRRPFRPEISEKDDQGIDALVAQLLLGGQHMGLVLDDGLELYDGDLLRPALFRHLNPSLPGQFHRKTVSADGYDAQF